MKVFWASVLAVILGVTAAKSEDLGQAGGWDIFFYETGDQQICGMGTEFDGGTYLYLKTRSSDFSIFVQLYNDKWRSIRNEQQYELSVRFSGEKKASFKTEHAEGINENSNTGLWFFVNSQFVDDFRRKNSIRFILKGGRELNHLSLKGTTKGLGAIVDCIKAKFVDPEKIDPFKGLENENDGEEAEPTPDASTVSDPFTDI